MAHGPQRLGTETVHRASQRTPELGKQFQKESGGVCACVCKYTHIPVSMHCVLYACVYKCTHVPLETYMHKCVCLFRGRKGKIILINVKPQFLNQKHFHCGLRPGKPLDHLRNNSVVYFLSIPNFQMHESDNSERQFTQVACLNSQRRGLILLEEGAVSHSAPITAHPTLSSIFQHIALVPTESLRMTVW